MECDVPKSITEISLVFTDDKTIQELNKNYRGKDKPTDVLSFSQLENPEFGIEPITLGDLVISVETAKRQAKKYEHSLQREIERLLIHGTLHLLGYDHEKVDKNIAQKMRRKEKYVHSILSPGSRFA